MNVEYLRRFFVQRSFREAVWLFPLAYALHVAEEWPEFPVWAQRYASERFTREGYVALRLTGLIVALLAPLAIWLVPKKPIAFIFFAFIFTPAVFFNVLFRAGATAASGRYYPGLITAVLIYLPLYAYISQRAFREGLLTDRQGLITL